MICCFGGRRWSWPEWYSIPIISMCGHSAWIRRWPWRVRLFSFFSIVISTWKATRSVSRRPQNENKRPTDRPTDRLGTDLLGSSNSSQECYTVGRQMPTSVCIFHHVYNTWAMSALPTHPTFFLSFGVLSLDTHTRSSYTVAGREGRNASIFDILYLRN